MFVEANVIYSELLFYICDNILLNLERKSHCKVIREFI